MLDGVKALRRSFRETTRLSTIRYQFDTSKHEASNSEIDLQMQFQMDDDDDTEDSMHLPDEIDNNKDKDDNPNRLTPNLELKHNKSNSAPTDIDQYLFKNAALDMTEILRSFDILSKYGFCSVVKQ